MNPETETPRVDRLSDLMFKEEAPSVSDLKLMPGDDQDITEEDVARELLESCERMGIVQDGKVVNSVPE